MKKKSKVSHVKRTNQKTTKLTKQGKLKKSRNKRKITLPKNNQQLDQNHSDSEQEDVVPTLDDDDFNFLKKAVKGNSYTFLQTTRLSVPDPLVKNPEKRKAKAVEEDVLERKYEADNQQPNAKKRKILLPIKTAQGLVGRAEDLDESEYEDDVSPDNSNKTAISESQPTLLHFAKGEFSAAQLLAARQKTLQSKRFRIGLLCAGLLESPESKIANFKVLFDLMDETDPQVRISVRKIVLISLVEVFKDLLPAYQIRHSEESNVRLKKDVRQLHDYESNLLKSYKLFLQKIEKLISILRRKKGDMRVFKDVEIRLAEIALQSLCDILKAHPYFNFSKNIVHLIVPFLNCNRESARAVVKSCIQSIFRSDTRGEISLEIVRCINKLVKSKNNSVHPAALEVLLSLKLKDVNLDSENEAEMKKKKMISKKHNILRLSKRERKRDKRLKELNQELLETKADENKQTKQHHLTEITKLVFAMYFRVLKGSPSSKLMKAALEGIAKFAHCINIDFYHDLINVLDSLIESKALGNKEQLCCVQTVFVILGYHGATINIDPVRFYTHFYNQLLQVSIGKNHGDLAMVLSAAEGVVIKRRKQLTMQRLLAFTKRLTTLALQVLPNGVLSLLCLIRQVLQASKASGVLLDTDATFGQGVYQPELEEPEYCNAGGSALWELLAMQRHYHSTVREYARYVCSLNDASKESTASGKAFIQQTYQELYREYDPTEMKFVPAVPPPGSVQGRKIKGRNKITNVYLKEYMKEALSTIKK